MYQDLMIVLQCFALKQLTSSDAGDDSKLVSWRCRRRHEEGPFRCLQHRKFDLTFLLNIFEMQSGCPKFSKTGPATKCFGLGDREWACEYNGQSRWRRSSFKVCNCWTKTYICIIFVHVCCIYRHRPCSTLLVPSKVKVVWGEELPLRVKTVLSHTVPHSQYSCTEWTFTQITKWPCCNPICLAPHGRFRAWSFRSEKIWTIWKSFGHLICAARSLRTLSLGKTSRKRNVIWHLATSTVLYCYGHWLEMLKLDQGWKWWEHGLMDNSCQNKHSVVVIELDSCEPASHKAPET